MNNFEKYLQDNKDKLQSDSVDEKVWLMIENEMLKSKNRRSKRFLRITFIVIFMSLLGCLIYVLQDQDEGLNEQKILAEYDLTKYNFEEKVNTKKQQLVSATVPETKFEDFQILLQQLEFMDGQFQDYIRYIEQNGYQEFIGDQILNFYKSKIELLDKIKSEIDKINYYEKIKPSYTEYVTIEI